MEESQRTTDHESLRTESHNYNPTRNGGLQMGSPNPEGWRSPELPRLELAEGRALTGASFGEGWSRTAGGSREMIGEPQEMEVRCWGPQADVWLMGWVCPWSKLA